MSNFFCINKSGITVPVYSDAAQTSQIGSIYNREAFGLDMNWGGDGAFYRIVFLAPTGSLSYGILVDPSGDALTDCTEYPYGTEKIDGTEYYTFIMRKSRTVYTAGGSRWGTVAANCRVACLSAVAGDAYPNRKGINYVESTNGDWVKVTGDKVEYGFVDTGLDVASSYRSIPFYGSW